MARVRKEITIAREQEAWRLRLLGWTQQRIADHLGCEQSTISYALARMADKLSAEFREHAEQVKAEQAAALLDIFRKAMEQWDRSCQDVQRVQVVTGRVKVEQGMMTRLPDLETVTTEGRSGNPALLAQAMKAFAEIRAIWCPDTAKQEISGPGGGPVAITELVVELKKGETE